MSVDRYSKTPPETTRLVLRIAVFIDMLIGAVLVALYFTVFPNIGIGLAGGLLIGSGVILLALIPIFVPGGRPGRDPRDEIRPPRHDP